MAIVLRVRIAQPQRERRCCARNYPVGHLGCIQKKSFGWVDHRGPVILVHDLGDLRFSAGHQWRFIQK